jgi:hypothetical protein
MLLGKIHLYKDQLFNKSCFFVDKQLSILEEDLNSKMRMKIKSVKYIVEYIVESGRRERRERAEENNGLQCIEFEII